MDATEFSEGQYVTSELVKASPTKVCVVIDEAKPEKTDYGESLHCKVQLDQKTKVWRLNRDSVRNMIRLGTDTRLWVGRKVTLMVVSVKGKEAVIGVPVMEVTA